MNKFNISWTDHITNQTVLNKIIKDKELLENMKIRVLEYMRHSINLFRISHWNKIVNKISNIQK